MRNRAVAAIRAVLVFACMRGTIVNAAICREDIACLQNVLVDMIVMNVMQMSVVQVVGMRIVLHRGVAAVRAVHVVVALMGLMHRF